jgi:sialate O-acetylesterase
MMRKTLFCLGLVGLTTAYLGAPLQADVVPAFVFGDNAVLQRDKPIPVWGTADGGEKVTVSFSGQTANTTADAAGKWRVDLPALPANATPANMVIKGKNTVTRTNILVGEVWLASGQSNMEQRVRETFDSALDIAGSARYPMIRELRPDTKTSYTPLSTSTGSWKVAGPETTGEFSAIGYHYALTLYNVLNVPVGIINTSQGASKISTWMNLPTLQSDPYYAGILEEGRKKIAEYPAVKIKLDADVKKWEADKAAAEAAKTPFTTPRPGPGWAGTTGGPDDRFLPSTFYNGMINPLLPYALRGVIWYQAEGDAGLVEYYAKAFPALITSWRTAFGQGDIPFYWVQLSAYGDNKWNDGLIWPLMREAQGKALSLPNTGQAISFDLGEPQNIHPQRKQEIGRRLARIALNRTYGHKQIVDTGPTVDKIEREGAGFRVRFKSPNGWPVFAPLTLPISGFELAGEDKVFKPAVAAVGDRNTSILVTSAEVPNPVAVRYGWRDFPNASLVHNTQGLPVEQFRSDNWPR